MPTVTQPYASRYTHILSLVEAYLLDARRNKSEIPKSRFTVDWTAERRGDERDGFWAVLDHMAATTKEMSGLIPAAADFRPSATLGSGRFGTVEVVSSAYDGQLYAMKTISKSAIQRSGSTASIGVERHIHLFAARRGEWVPIPALHAAFQSTESLHLVTELATCGSLWDRMGLDDEPFPFASPVRCATQTDDVRNMDANEIRWWACQMVEAIAWLHEQGFVHRDIKPQNFLIDASARILLTDFGVAAPLEPSSAPPCSRTVSAKDCAVPAGTPDYIAPEVLLAGEAAAAAAWNDGSGEEMVYTASIDHWSLGATVYEMAIGQAPFIARSIAGTYARITAYDLDKDVMRKQCSDPALLDLIAGLLCPAKERLDTADLRRHPFFATIDWDEVRSGTAMPPRDLPPVTPRGLEEESILGQSQFSFSFAPRYDQTSPASNFADFTQFTQPFSDPSEWLGWTWMPDPADLRDTARPTTCVSPVKLDMDDRYRTPRRQTSGPNFKPPPSTAKRVPKKTPGSNPYFDLLKCVHESAKKKRTLTGQQQAAPKEQVSIEAVEQDISKLIGELQGLRTRLDSITR